MALEDVPRCQHVKTNGTQCGSPALRRRRLCFFHNRIRRERAADKNSFIRFDIPLLEDANSVQMALMQVIQRLGAGTLDHKTAGLMLYALQTASINLRYTDFEAGEATDVVIDRDTVDATCINGPQWFEEDFEADAEEDEIEDDEAEDETAAEQRKSEHEKGEEASKTNGEDAAQSDAASGIDRPPRKKPKPVSAAEAREQVREIARKFLLDAITPKPQQTG